MKVVEAQATKLGFTWARLNLHHPRVVLKQSDCEQFESRLGNCSKIMYEAEALFVTSVYIRPAALQVSGNVRGCARPTA